MNNILNKFYFVAKMQKYKDALELHALQDDQTCDQLRKDNQDLLQKIQVSDLTIKMLAGL